MRERILLKHSLHVGWRNLVRVSLIFAICNRQFHVIYCVSSFMYFISKNF